MQKIPKLLSSILITSVTVSLGFSAKTQALYIDEDEATWYTVAELLDYQKQVEQEKSELCGDDINCRENWFYDRFESDPKLQALDNLEQYQFVVTAINPQAETFKVLAFSENMMLKRWGISEKVTIDKFYLAWFDNREAQGQIGNFGAYEEELLNNTLSGTHTIFAYQKDRTRLDFPSATDTEVELQMLPNSNLIADPIGSLGYLVDGEGYNAVGGVHYSTCLNAADYSEGKECRMMISAEKGVSYFPPRETVMSTEGNEQENNQENEQIDEHTSDPVQGRPVISSQINSSPSMPKTPNTGGSNEQNQTTFEFPWWLGAILIINLLTLLWLFLPLGLSKPKKS